MLGLTGKAKSNPPIGKFQPPRGAKAKSSVKVLLCSGDPKLPAPSAIGCKQYGATGDLKEFYRKCFAT
jgi:hypothetical protein